MSAAPRHDYRRPPRPTVLPHSQRRVLEAVAKLNAAGEPLLGVNLVRELPDIPYNTVRSAYSQLVKRGLATSRRGQHRPPTVYEEVEPCGRCGDPKGYRLPGRRRPERRIVPGMAKPVCRACHLAIQKQIRDNEPRFDVWSETADQVIRQRAAVIRAEAIEFPNRYKRIGMEGYDADRARILVGFKEVRAVADEQAARLLKIRSAGLPSRGESARRGALKARREYWAAWGRLSQHQACCRVGWCP